MSDVLSTDAQALPLSAQLKSDTHEIHDTLDRRVSDAHSFDDRERYGLFLQMQYLFHRVVDRLFADPELGELLPGLATRRRLHLIVQDMSDLGVTQPVHLEATADIDPNDLPKSLGWLYVAEGSNLGAAFLFKRAEALGLHAEFGARHLAPHPDGRGLNWRVFKTELDAIPLSQEQQKRAVDSAHQAFEYVHELARQVF